MGRVFGTLIETVIGDVKRYETVVLGMVAVIGMVVWAIYFYRRGRGKRFFGKEVSFGWEHMTI
jgi:hypothetical protein